MTDSALFAIGTLAHWLGWILILRSIYLAVALVLSGDGVDRKGTLRSLGSNTVVAGVLLVGSYLTPIRALEADGALFRLPVAWPVIPFAGWGVIACVIGMSARLFQSVLAINSTERKDKLSAAGIWLVGAALMGVWYRQAEGSVDLLRGSIPLGMKAAVAILVLAIGTVFAMAASARSVAARGYAKGIATHTALIVGSVVFGLPFVWLLITSFKEDRDMASPTGLVWIPKTTKMAPYFDPDDRIVETTFQGKVVQGNIVQDNPDGSVVIDVFKPGVLRGITVNVKPPLKLVPKEVPVGTFTFEGKTVEGMAIKDNVDGSRDIRIIAPPELKGRTAKVQAGDFELIRTPGLRVQNYSDALDFLPVETAKGLVYFKNTVLLVILSVIGTILSSSVVAYAFARLKFPGRDALFVVLLSTMMLPAAVTMLPTFLIFKNFGWVDTLLPIWVPAFLGSAFNIFMLRQFFSTIPFELEDAAKIDGCSYPKTFWTIMMPQIKPALAVVAIWTTMGAWNNFMGPLVYINSPEKMPISYAVQLFQSDRGSEPGLMMAFATMGMLPVLLLFFFAQKYFIEGVTLSGLGGR